MGRFCPDCGQQLTFFRKLTSSLCSDCEGNRISKKNREVAELKAERDALYQEIIVKKEIDSDQIEWLKKQEKSEQIKLFFEILSQFESDKEMEKNEIEALGKMQTGLGLTDDEINFEDRLIPHIYTYSIKNENTIPPVSLNIGEGMSNVILKKNEEIKFVVQAKLKEPRIVKLGYEGGSHGVSIRLMKGVSYRVGAHRGHIRKEEQLVDTSSGYFMITNKRILLHPFPGRKSVSIPLEKMLSYNCFENGIEIYKDGREKGYFFQTKNKSSPEVAGMVLGFLFEQQKK
ncbi:MAG: Atg14 domain-containing protein [Methanoregula sp.]|jgi:hypothetical protein|nr:Atg14 domain-containing protein [Methanoregula sp.]